MGWMQKYLSSNWLNPLLRHNQNPGNLTIVYEVHLKRSNHWEQDCNWSAHLCRLKFLREEEIGGVPSTNRGKFNRLETSDISAYFFSFFSCSYLFNNRSNS